MSHQYCALEDTVYFGFAANLTTGAAGDGATPLYDVRLAGAASSAAPVLSGTPTLLSHANYTDGLHEVAVAATAANGFAAGNTYLVFVTLTISAVTPAACIGSFKIAPVPANVTQLLGTAWLTPAVAGTPDVNVKQLSGDATAADNAEAFFDGTGYAGTGNVIPTVTTVNGLAAGTITAASIATGAVDADAIAADAGVEIAAAVWDRVLSGATHNITNSAGRRLRTLDASSIRTGTAQGGAANSITLDAAASATNDIYDRNLIVLTGGTGEGQARVIVEYNGTTKVAIVDRVWEVNPDVTSEFQLLADHQTGITHHGLAQAGGATSITLSTGASATNDLYASELILLTTGVGAGQTRLITAYNGTTKVATVSPAWVTNPDSTSVYNVLPAGRVEVASMAAGSIVAATFAAGAIDAAAIATDAIGAAELADGAITAATFAAGAIDATAIATGAVDADALAADASTELVAAIAAMVIEGAVTLKQSLQLANAANAGKLSGAATTTVSIRDLGDTKNRVVGTVDADGNRSAITVSYD